MSSLPKIEQKWHQTTLLSSNKNVEFRGFKVGEQKELLIVKGTSKSDGDLYAAIVNMIQGCVKDLQVKELSIVDFEKLFYDIRSVSDGNNISVTIKCPKCKTENTLDVNTTNDFEIKNPDNKKLVMDIVESGDAIKAFFEHPNVKDSAKVEKKKYSSDEEKAFDMVAFCLKKVVQGESVATDFSHDEALNFIESLPGNYFEKIEKFFGNAPSLVINKEFNCTSESCGKPIIKRGEPARDFLS